MGAHELSYGTLSQCAIIYCFVFMLERTSYTDSCYTDRITTQAVFMGNSKRTCTCLEFGKGKCAVGLDTLGKFSTILYKVDNFCDFLFASPYAKPLLKKESSLKGKNLLQGKQIVSF